MRGEVKKRVRMGPGGHGHGEGLMTINNLDGRWLLAQIGNNHSLGIKLGKIKP